MSKTGFFLATALAVSLLTPARAEELNGGELIYVHLYDANKDDLIQPDELVNAFENTDPFYKRDVNHDGKVTVDEYPGLAKPGTIMADADTDHDGGLTEAEYDAGVARASAYWFGQCDKDQSKSLSHAEMVCILR